MKAIVAFWVGTAESAAGNADLWGEAWGAKSSGQAVWFFDGELLDHLRMFSLETAGPIYLTYNA